MSHVDSLQTSLALPQPPHDLTGAHGKAFTRRWVIDITVDLVDAL